MNQPIVMVPEMCQTHQSLLVHQALYAETDPWQALIVMANVALFQGASADPKIHAECQGDITHISKLGCLGCRKPDLFGEIVEAAKTHELGDIKTLGEKWVQNGSRPQ